jgi:hypothetical protein
MSLEKEKERVEGYKDLLEKNIGDIRFEVKSKELRIKEMSN